MGSGHYDLGAHKRLAQSRATLPREKIFAQSGVHPDMNPHGLVTRKSRDSANHPESNAVIFALDVTGSMGHIPHALATEQLPGFMQLLNDGSFLPDPQLLFAGIGDAKRDSGPLQIGQFESEGSLMDKWLTSIWLEGGGGGNGGESYELAFHFAARHTSMDCWEKRGRKGYLFLTGDDNPFPVVSRNEIRSIFGSDPNGDTGIREIVDEASRTFHPFFLIPDLNRRHYCEGSWRRHLGDHVICMETHEDTCAVTATIIGLTEGNILNLDEVAARLQSLGIERDQTNRVVRAVEPYAHAIGRGGKRRTPRRR